MKSRLFPALMSFVVVCFVLLSGVAVAQEEKSEAKEQEAVVDLDLAGGEFSMKAPEAWKNVEPKSSMVEVEFSVPMADGDKSERAGRLTIMAAGGSVEQNIERWKGQFAQPDGSSTSDKTKVEEIEVGGMTAHMVDISGTYAERARMTAPPTMREDYRMLAAIIETGSRKYFVKFYAGAETVEANKKRFDGFIKSFAKGDK